MKDLVGDTLETVSSRTERTLPPQGITLDDAQRQLAGQVRNFIDAAAAVSSTAALEQNGFFIYGPPGRGKTWLMTKLFEAAPFPVESKRHVHFHDFFRSLQQQLGPKTSMREAIDITLAKLLTGTELFFFDELHVHDPGSAALLNRLLAEITARGIPTLITSNYEPEGLLADQMFHHVIEPSIKMLRSNFHIAVLDGGTDYRSQSAGRGSGFASGHWLIAGPGQDSHDVLTAAGLRPPSEDEAMTVLEGHRALRANAVRGTEIWFDFENLLAVRSVTNDFLELAEQFNAWFLTNVPRLSQTTPAARQRLVTLIDVLVERDFPLTVCSVAAREVFVDIANPPPDLFRAQSRLHLLN